MNVLTPKKMKCGQCQRVRRVDTQGLCAKCREMIWADNQDRQDAFEDNIMADLLL